MTGNQSYIRTNGQRLWDSLMEMAKIGATEKGGCNRVAFTDEDKQARDLFVSWCEAAGCAVSVDQFGNIFARRSGQNNTLPAVIAGSHLDTQPTGGKFDGVYGVLAGLEVIRSLNDNNLDTEAPIEVAVWTNEEGCIFKPMLGSAVFTGMIPLQEALGMREETEGWSIKEGLERMGYSGSLPMMSYPVACYFEAHIEPLPFHPALVDTVRKFARAEGKPYQDIYTGAGHDACNLARFLPTTMIFVPCEGGISHNEIENAKSEDLEAGCNVLCNSIYEVATGKVDLN